MPIRFRFERRLEAFRRVPSGDSYRDHLLEAAWLLARRSRASSPGRSVAYYRLTDGGRRYPGERDWERRWETISAAVPLAGARVLELGCNMGLLSTFALARGGAAEALGVDHDPTVLAAAALVARAFDVRPAFRRVDLDETEGWEEGLLAFNPTVVFALNVLHWLKRKDRLLSFLGHTHTVVYEGHDDVPTESRRLEQVGFVRTSVLGVTERGRSLILATRA